MTRLAYICAFAALALALITATAVHAGPVVKAPIAASLPPVGPYPDAECNTGNSPGIYIGPDGVLWECICEERQFVTPDDDDCHWYEQGLATRPRNAKLVRKAKVSLRVTRLPRLVVIRLGY